MSLGNGTTVSGLGTKTTNSGHTLDQNGNVQVDFVWGNIARQPNDLRTTLTDTATATTTTDPVTGGVVRLVPGKDNHDIILGAWNGYPSYTPNDPGEFTQSSPVYSATTGLSTNTPYILVPNVLGLNAATTDTTVTLSGVSTVLYAYAAQDGLRDAGYQNANIKVNGTSQTNTAITVTAIARTAGSTTAVLTAAGAGAQYPVGTKVTVSALTGANVEFNGTWTVIANATNTFSITSLNSTVVSVSSLTGSVVGVAGTVFSQSVAPAANSITGSADITITKFA